MKRVLVLSAAVTIAATAAMSGQDGGGLDSQALKGIELRSLGPALATGRIQDVEIDPKNPSVWYVASAFGGLWKTTNRGITFTPIFDDQGAFTLCCVVVDPKDSNVVWVGSGENASQRSAHFGDGVYKSTDAGKTWNERRPEIIGAHRQDRHRSAQFKCRVCCLAGPTLVGWRRARALQDHRQRCDVERGPDGQPRHRHQRRRV